MTNNVWVMRFRPALPLALVLGATSAAALAACGSTNQSATVATAPTAAAPAQTTATDTTTSTTPAAPSRQKTTSTAAGSAQTTRTATAPAFVGGTQANASGPLRAATAVVTRAGYTPVDTATYMPDQTLQVLVGTRGAGTAREQQAFFFVAGRYIGTDARSPSRSIAVVSQNDTAVTLSYGVYRSGGPPGGESTTVQFALNNGHLTPLGSIPPASERR